MSLGLKRQDIYDGCEVAQDANRPKQNAVFQCSLATDQVNSATAAGGDHQQCFAKLS